VEEHEAKTAIDVDEEKLWGLCLQLEDMGFTDRARNEVFLRNNRCDLAATIDSLIASSVEDTSVIDKPAKQEWTQITRKERIREDPAMIHSVPPQSAQSHFHASSGQAPSSSQSQTSQCAYIHTNNHYSHHPSVQSHHTHLEIQMQSNAPTPTTFIQPRIHNYVKSGSGTNAKPVAGRKASMEVPHTNTRTVGDPKTSGVNTGYSSFPPLAAQDARGDGIHEDGMAHFSGEALHRWNAEQQSSAEDNGRFVNNHHAKPPVVSQQDARMTTQWANTWGRASATGTTAFPATDIQLQHVGTSAVSCAPEETEVLSQSDSRHLLASDLDPNAHAYIFKPPQHPLDGTYAVATGTMNSRIANTVDDSPLPSQQLPACAPGRMWSSSAEAGMTSDNATMSHANMETTKWNQTLEDPHLCANRETQVAPPPPRPSTGWVGSNETWGSGALGFGALNSMQADANVPLENWAAPQQVPAALDSRISAGEEVPISGSAMWGSGVGNSAAMWSQGSFGPPSSQSQSKDWLVQPGGAPAWPGAPSFHGYSMANEVDQIPAASIDSVWGSTPTWTQPSGVETGNAFIIPPPLQVHNNMAWDHQEPILGGNEPYDPPWDADLDLAAIVGDTSPVGPQSELF